MSVRRRIAAALAKGARETARDAGIGATTGAGVAAASGHDGDEIARRAAAGAAVGAGAGRVVRSMVTDAKAVGRLSRELRTGNAEAVSSVRRGRGLLPSGEKAKERVSTALSKRAERRRRQGYRDDAFDDELAANRVRGGKTPTDADLRARRADAKADLDGASRERPSDYHEAMGLSRYTQSRREEIGEIDRYAARRAKRRTDNAEAVSAVKRQRNSEEIRRASQRGLHPKTEAAIIRYMERNPNASDAQITEAVIGRDVEPRIMDVYRKKIARRRREAYEQF